MADERKYSINGDEVTSEAPIPINSNREEGGPIPPNWSGNSYHDQVKKPVVVEDEPAGDVVPPSTPAGINMQQETD